MYDNSFECIETYTDNGGGIAIAVVKGEIEEVCGSPNLSLVTAKERGYMQLWLG